MPEPRQGRGNPRRLGPESVNYTQSERHGIAEIGVAIRHPAAIEADELGVAGDVFDFFKQVVAGQYAQVPLVFALAFVFHG
jgi:hypothetical protein